MDEVLTSTDWVTCPYDSNHRMKYSKFHNHFVKCKEAHPDDPREQCPYYASELIHRDKMKEHLLTCKYKALYSDMFRTDNLPVYDTPRQFNIDEENGNVSDDDAETIINHDRDKDDGSSLFSGTTRWSYKTNSVVSEPIGKLRANNYIDSKPKAKSYAFRYIEEDDSNTSLGKSQLDDGEKYSWQSSGTESLNDSSSYSGDGSFNLSIPNSPVKPCQRKLGLGRGKVITRLLSSSSSSLSSNGSIGRGAWFRLRTTDLE